MFYSKGDELLLGRVGLQSGSKRGRIMCSVGGTRSGTSYTRCKGQKRGEGGREGGAKHKMHGEGVVEGG